MNEEFLHYIWKTQQFKPNQLFLNNQQKLLISKTGIHNFNAGPDFLEADIKLDETRWLGSVEIHLKASDWYRHNHQVDKAYDQVVLHVVWMNDKRVFRQNGSEIPCLELQGNIPKYLIDNYSQLIANRNKIACREYWPWIDEFHKVQTIEKMLLERIQSKTKKLEQFLRRNNEHWEAAFYHFLFCSFGFKVNEYAFSKLSESIPLKVLNKYKNNPSAIEALLFGQAGFLEELSHDEYHQQLQKSYQLIKTKHKLIAIKMQYWKKSRLRPANFPCLRIAQLATLLTHNNMYADLIHSTRLLEIEVLENVQPNPYWQNHLSFGKKSKTRNPRLGKTAIHLLNINHFLPFMFFYTQAWKLTPDLEKILDLYRKMPAEKNKITRLWEEVGWKPENAFESQALIQLKSQYCDSKKCLICSIGNEILKLDHHDKSNT